MKDTRIALCDVRGPLTDLLERLSGENGAMWLQNLNKLLRGELSEKTTNDFLQLVSGGKSIVLNAADGKRVIADAKNVFTWIDGDFKNWNADEQGKKTETTTVRVYEMIKDATFEQMFGSLSSDPRKLCLTQDQIIGFVEKHRILLPSKGYGNFFLFESNEKFFVAGVGVRLDGGLDVGVHRFESSCVWDAEYRRRVVLPQLA